MRNRFRVIRKRDARVGGKDDADPQDGVTQKHRTNPLAEGHYNESYAFDYEF